MDCQCGGKLAWSGVGLEIMKVVGIWGIGHLPKMLRVSYICDKCFQIYLQEFEYGRQDERVSAC